MVQVTYDIDRSTRIGNEPIVAALRALDKFEVAVGGDSRLGGYAAVPDRAPAGPGSPTMTGDLVASHPDGEKRLQLASPDGGAQAEEEVINYRVRSLSTAQDAKAILCPNLSHVMRLVKTSVLPMIPSGICLVTINDLRMKSSSIHPGSEFGAGTFEAQHAAPA